MTPEFGPSPHPAPSLYPLSSLPSLLAPSPLLSFLSLPSPFKVQGFLRKLAWSRGPTLDIIQSFYPRLTLLPNSCPLCQSAEASNDDLFLHCRFSWELSGKLFKLMNLCWVMLIRAEFPILFELVPSRKVIKISLLSMLASDDLGYMDGMQSPCF